MFKKLFKIFKEDGFSLYFVGGCVRDYLLGRVPKDYDFATDATPDKIQEILAKGQYKTWPLGERFGTIAARVGEHQIEITTFREDVTSGRHPEVSFTKDLEKDLKRRDFTINSMAMDEKNQIVDPFGGQKDLAKGVIRTTGLPMSRFGEDPLRMLRAVRFVSQLGFNVHGSVSKVIILFAHAIMSISRERWLEEMNKILMGKNVSKSLELLYKTRLLGYIIPEAFPLTVQVNTGVPSKNLWKHTKAVVESSELNLNVRWAALLHDIGKPSTLLEKDFKIHFFQHEFVSSELAQSVCLRLRMGNSMRKAICGLVAMHHKIGDVVSRKNHPPVSKSALRRIAKDCEERGSLLDELIDLFAADCTSKQESVQERQRAHVKLLKEAVVAMREEDLRPKLPKGVGLVIMEKYNFPPGSQIKEVKDKLDEMLMDGRITTDMSVERMLEEYEKV